MINDYNIKFDFNDDLYEIMKRSPIVAQGTKYDCKLDRLLVRIPLEKNKYFYFLRYGVEAQL